MKGLKENLKLTQRTAVGNDDSGQSKVYLYLDDYGLLPTCKDDDYDVEVTVTHPYIMAGSWDDIKRDVAIIIDQRLADRGILGRNDYGFASWL